MRVLLTQLERTAHLLQCKPYTCSQPREGQRRGTQQVLGMAKRRQLLHMRKHVLSRGPDRYLEVDDDQEDDDGGHELGDVGEGAAVEGLLQRPHLHAHQALHFQR